MKAVIHKQYGGPEVLGFGDVERPVPAANEVLVKIYASAVTQADVMMRKGGLAARMVIGFTKPKAPVPGTAFAGKIEAVGKDVSRFNVGDDVFGETTTGFHTHAQYVAVPEDGVIETVPFNMTYEEAAPITDGLLTVHNFLTNVAKVRPGQKVLINGAAGGLGTSAVQLAKHLGAEVTGVASGRNSEWVRKQGADHFIDYTKEDFTKGDKRYDVIFDTVGKVPFGKARKALKPFGTYLSPVISLKLMVQMLWTSKFSAKKAKFSATGLLPHDRLSAALGQLKPLIEQGKLWTEIEKRFPLEEIAEAHAYVDSGHKRGNVVLEIAHEDAVMLAAE